MTRPIFLLSVRIFNPPGLVTRISSMRLISPNQGQGSVVDHYPSHDDYRTEKTDTIPIPNLADTRISQSEVLGGSDISFPASSPPTSKTKQRPTQSCALGSSPEPKLKAGTNLILHPDILNHIFRFCAKPTLYTLLQSCKSFYHFAVPHLYSNITLDLSQDQCSTSSTASASTLATLLAILIRPTPSDANDTRPQPLVDACTSTFFSQHHKHEHEHENAYAYEHRRKHIQYLIITAHFDTHPTDSPILPLPNLEVLHLTIHRESPISWSFCKPSDRGRYPYYPISQACCLLQNLQPQKLVISGQGIRSLNIPKSPFPLPTDPFWREVEEIVIHVDMENIKEGSSKAKYKDGFISDLSKLKQLKRLVIHCHFHPQPQSQSQSPPHSQKQLGRANNQRVKVAEGNDGKIPHANSNISVSSDGVHLTNDLDDMPLMFDPALTDEVGTQCDPEETTKINATTIQDFLYGLRFLPPTFEATITLVLPGPLWRGVSTENYRTTNESCFETMNRL
ncbi:uncharacterized protein I303_101838 [Kwoniella dejecticola CBS 10117]|uniref:F-box domain-containing protein n=1 Tax=Kwoniella dejecticola CBS 10117 TaxID=1296121 RepID=A0A1A6ACP2_9TREE|nr:uncharacterized protein I303_02026 [Kwoniella dejecticola CBS 10117]OBR87813.1 hypothetical protein I303_02026 [Kwoniella dejecticola CBS 10117]